MRNTNKWRKNNFFCISITKYDIFYAFISIDFSDDTEEAAPKPTSENQDIIELTPELIEAVKRYDEVYEFSEGFARVVKDLSSGFINGLAIVITANKWEYIDKK